MHRRRILSDNNRYVDICFYNNSRNDFIFVNGKDFHSNNYPLSEYTPIGVVAVPSSHINKEYPIIVSLVDMSCDTPDSGSFEESTVYFGYIDEDIYNNQASFFDSGTPYYYKVISCQEIIQEDDIELAFDSDWCYVASEFSNRLYNSQVNPLNPNEYFPSCGGGEHYRMISPFLKNGSFNELFNQKEGYSSFSYYDARQYQNYILARFDNAISINWQTASTINNIRNDKYTHPAFQCCWRFHTDGTKQGNWYLPSCRELSYMAVQTQEIERTFDKLNEEYNIEIACKFSMDRSRPNTDYYLSSTFHKYKENNNVLLRRFDLFNTALGVMSGNNENSRVRAFCEFNFL